MDLQGKEMKMDRIGLTFEEHAELKVRPRVGEDAVFGHVAAMASRDVLSDTKPASSHLRGHRGYDGRTPLYADGVTRGRGGRTGEPLLSLR